MKVRSRRRLAAEAFEGIALMGLVCVTWPASKRWLRNWGSTRQERMRSWPGDDLIELPAVEHTRAITIEAPAADVWKWVVQFGLDRAGFYSYELLERMVGIPVTNVESIEDQWQTLSIGDEVRLHPQAGIRVSYLEENHFVCFGEQTSRGETATDPSPHRCWSVFVEPITESASRLLIRGRVDRPSRHVVLSGIARAIEQPIDFVMEQRMLRTIKRLTERRRKKGTGSKPRR